MLLNKPSKILTLLLIQQKDKILLAMKKKGFGKGKYNGFGGKVQRNGQTIFQAAIRQTQQEGCITPINARFVAYFRMEFDCEPEVFKIHVFKATEFEGEVSQTQQMKPEWFNISQIPYEKMWIDDSHWLPLLIKDKVFTGYFLFEGHQKLKEVDLKQISQQQLQQISKKQSQIKLK